VAKKRKVELHLLEAEEKFRGRKGEKDELNEIKASIHALQNVVAQVVQGKVEPQTYKKPEFQRPRNRNERPETRSCFKCGKPGHLIRDCRSKRNSYGQKDNYYKDNNRRHEKSDEPSQKMLPAAQGNSKSQ